MDTGPYAGKKFRMSDAVAEEYKKQAEAKFGRYIPGSLLREPRFLPGTERDSLPLFEIDPRSGIESESGYIDEMGIHRYPQPKSPIA